MMVHIAAEGVRSVRGLFRLRIGANPAESLRTNGPDEPDLDRCYGTVVALP